jgi:hypothetical protein
LILLISFKDAGFDRQKRQNKRPGNKCAGGDDWDTAVVLLALSIDEGD